MPELEHEIAIYFDEQFKRHEIKAKDLVKPDVLEKAKLKELYDESAQIRVFPRTPEDKRPHFMERGDRTGNRILRGGEDDPRHNARVDELVKALSSITELSLGIKEPSKVKGGEDKLYKLFDLPDYQWEDEVHRIQDANTIVRHDVYGQRLELSMSVLFPWIAIEVINTHYPEEDTFAALLKTSENVPLIVLFDFVSHPNTFVKVNLSEKLLQLRPWSYYIKKGQVYQGDYPTDITSSARLKIEFDAMVNRWAEKRKTKPEK